MGEQITSGSLDRSGPGRVVGGGQNWELETRAHNFNLPTRGEKSISIYSIDRQETETGERSFLEKELISIRPVRSVRAIGWHSERPQLSQPPRNLPATITNVIGLVFCCAEGPFPHTTFYQPTSAPFPSRSLFAFWSTFNFIIFACTLNPLTKWRNSCDPRSLAPRSRSPAGAQYLGHRAQMHSIAKTKFL